MKCIGTILVEMFYFVRKLWSLKTCLAKDFLFISLAIEVCGLKKELSRIFLFHYMSACQVWPICWNKMVLMYLARRKNQSQTRDQNIGGKKVKETQWPIGYGVGLRIKRSSVRIRLWPLRWVLGQGSLLPLSQGEAFTLASISYLAILVKYILAKKKKVC